LDRPSQIIHMKKKVERIEMILPKEEMVFQEEKASG
jgi:hypothetical protein